jgi:hypothetical protein
MGALAAMAGTVHGQGGGPSCSSCTADVQTPSTANGWPPTRAFATGAAEPAARVTQRVVEPPLCTAAACRELVTSSALEADTRPRWNTSLQTEAGMACACRSTR